MNFAFHSIAKGLKLHRQWIVACTLSITGSMLHASHLTDYHQYDIAEGPLAAALTQFANQTGIYLSSTSDLLIGKSTQGYQGAVSGIEALNALLEGTGLTFKETDSGNIIIQDSLSEDSLTFSPLLVEANRSPQVTHSTIDQDDIDTMAGTTGSMTSLLQNNSSVQYSRSSNLSANAASLRPEEISIHGQASYQNAYLIDGVGTNNDLNPGDNEDTFSSPITPTNPGMLGGSSSQSYYVDPDAISKITVYDVNIPAEYGGFTGGVVDTELLRYQGEEYTSIKYAVSGSDFNSMHVDEDTKQSFEDGDSYDGSYTPDFTKQRVSLTSVQEINDKLAGGLMVSRAQSDFKQVYKDRSSSGSNIPVEYTDQLNNVMGRLDYSASDRLNLGLSVRYSDRNHDGITADTFDSPFIKTHQAYGLTGESIYDGESGSLTTKLSFDRAFDQLDSESSTYTTHPTEFYNGNSAYSGGYGDVRQQQDTSALDIKWEHNPLLFGATSHSLSTGLQISNIDAFYEVEDDIIAENYSCLSGSFSAGCDDSNNDGTHDINDEYLLSKHVLSANRFNKSYQTYGMFLGDRIQTGNWTFNLALRADYETLLENLNIAPRTSVIWDSFGDESTVVTAGANRYYGRSFLRYAINDTLRSWRTQYRYNRAGELVRTTNYDDRSVSDYDLKTPYSDELSLSLAQKMGPMKATLTGVMRDSKDGVQRTRNDNFEYYYTNSGVSKHQSLSLKLETLKGFQLGSTLTHLETSISVQDSTSNSQSDNAYDEAFNEDAVYYEGSVIYSDDLPTWDYSIPFQFSFRTTTEIPSWNLIWSNNLNLHAGGKVATDSGDDVEIDGASYDVYENVEFDRYATLDTNFTWTPNIVRDLDGYLQVGINNVFDKVIDVSTNDSNSSYTVGRSVSLELGMRF
jgi:YD repeat-containing protein